MSARYQQALAGGGPVTLAVLARLVAVAADGHRAPGGGAVARPVVERPLTGVLATCLEPRPAAVGHRAEDDPEDRAERGVDAAAGGLERALAVLAEADQQPLLGGDPVELLDRGRVERLAAVREQERSQSLA